MRVTFPRLPDHSRGYSVVERDDGVVYRLWGGPVSDRIPHDLVHLTVEDALGIGDGIWGAIAGGVVFDSMTYLRGRRLPHAAQRSTVLIRAYSSSLSRAELVGGFVERLVALDTSDAELLRRLVPARLTVLPPAEYPLTGMFGPDGQLDTDRVLRAVDRLRQAGAHWRAVPVGGELTRTWPPYRRLRAADPLRTGRSRAAVRVRARAR